MTQMLRQYFPAVQIFASARDRQHVFRLMDLGVTHIERATYQSSVLLTEQLLVGLGRSLREAKRAVLTFQAREEREMAAGHTRYQEVAAQVQTPAASGAEPQALLVADERRQDRPLD
ncbi:MAG: hypothetical protein EXR83_10760 [Gammaproteobacteria bacterium]|nr:hypothetical protein [Gammaproteobacteria bacterium]